MLYHLKYPNRKASIVSNTAALMLSRSRFQPGICRLASLLLYGSVGDDPADDLHFLEEPIMASRNLCHSDMSAISSVRNEHLIIKLLDHVTL